VHFRTLNGVCYLRIRSPAATPDPHGVFIRHVKVQIADSKAPAVTREQSGRVAAGICEDHRDEMVTLRWGEVLSELLFLSC
jgi:hypothetical protein